MCIKYPRVWQNILSKMFSDKERIPEMREKTTCIEAGRFS